MFTKPTQTKFSTSFTVMPKDCNYLQDMLFGGELLSQMDIAAAMAVRRAFYDIPLDTALTVGVNNVKFLVGASVGDLITLNAEVIKVGLKSIWVKVTGFRENKSNGERQDICTGEFTFVAVDENRKSTRHNLTLE